jgi:hypothetical protein
VVGISFGADEFPVCRELPEISSAGLKENASEGAERVDELGGIAALESGARKFE